MKTQNQKIKNNKSFTKKQIGKSKTITTNKNTSLKLNNKKNKTKSKPKEIKAKSKPKQKRNNQIKLDNSNLELNLNNYINNTNYISSDNRNSNYQYIPNVDIYNNYNSVSDFSMRNTNQFKNSLINNNDKNFDSVNMLMTSNQNNENQINCKRTIDRLIINSQNLLEKQNNILLECDILTKNAATNDYAIQNLIQNDEAYNNEKILSKYNNNALEILSKIKKKDKELELNVQLKNENESLKNKLDMANIDKEENFQIVSNELSSLKIVLVNEINHVLNIFKEFGYDNLPQEKLEINNITSQKIADFFQLIIKIIRQMKELIHNKETLISKMTIDQVTNRSNFDNINKSYEKLNIDNKNSIGYKTYNFSVRNNFHNKPYNISFRNMPKNNKNIDIIERTQKSLNITDFQNNNKYLDEDGLKYNSNKISSELINNHNEENRKCINDNNESERNYQTGNFAFKDILNINKNK